MQSSISNVPTANWCIYTREPGTIATDWDAVKQRIVIGLSTMKFSNPLKPFYFSNILDYIDKNQSISIPNIKKDIVQVIGIVAPEIVVTKIRHEANENGAIKFYISVEQADNATVLIYDTIEGIADFSSKGTVILEGDAPLYPEGFLSAKLDLSPTLSIVTGVYNTLKEVRDELTSLHSQYGNYGYTNHKLIAYINQEYPQAELSILDIETLDLCNTSGVPSGTVYIESITLGAIVDNTPRNFADLSAVVAWLNTTFKSVNNLSGTFFLGASTISYADIEGFGSGAIVIDTHVHDTVYDLVYN